MLYYVITEKMAWVSKLSGMLWSINATAGDFPYELEEGGFDINLWSIIKGNRKVRAKMITPCLFVTRHDVFTSCVSCILQDVFSTSSYIKSYFIL